MRKIETIKSKLSLDVNHISCLTWYMHSLFFYKNA